MTVINVTSLPAQVNHDVYKGDSFEHFVTIKENGTLVDISGDTFAVRIKDYRGSTLLNLSIGSGITLVSTGKIKYALTPVQSAALPLTSPMTYDLQWTRSTGFVKTLERGKLNAYIDVTP